MIRGVVASAASREKNPWTPLNLLVPPKILFDRDSAITSVSGYASAWSDRSGNGLHAVQSSAADRPLIVELPNGMKVLQFDGIKNNLDLPSAANSIFRNTSAGWIFVVSKNTGPSTTYGTEHPVVHFTQGGTTGTRIALYNGGGDYNSVQAGGRRLDSDAYQGTPADAAPDTAGEWVMALGALDYSAANAKAYVDGILSGENAAFHTSGFTSNTDSIRARIGATGATSTLWYFKGQIGVAVIGSGSIPSIDEIDKLFGWAAWECDLVHKLPESHPYKLSRPVVS